MMSWAPGQGPETDIEVYDDFTWYDGTGPVATTKWLHTAVNTTSFLCKADGLAITNAGADNDGLNVQLSCGAASGRFTVAADKDMYFYTRVKSSDADALDWFVGLGTVDTTFVAGANDAIGFGPGTGSTLVNAGSANLYAVHADDAAGTWAAAHFTDTGVDLADDTWVTLAFWVQGTSRVRYYVNGNEKVVSTTLPDAGALLTPTFACVDNGGAATVFTVERIYAARKY
jgi:hypothetical protein